MDFESSTLLFQQDLFFEQCIESIEKSLQIMVVFFDKNCVFQLFPN